MNANISERERKILSFLAIFVSIFLYFYFFFIPNVKSTKDLKVQIENYQNEYEINLEYEKKVENIDSDLKILYQKQKNIWRILPPYINYDEVLVLIKDSANKANLPVESIECLEEKAVKEEKNNDKLLDEKLDENTEGEELEENASEALLEGDNSLMEAIKFFGINKNEVLENEEGEVIKNGMGYYLPIKVFANGTYKQIKSFIGYMKEKVNNIEFSTINIVNNSTEKLEATLTLNFYGIKDDTAENYSMLDGEKWDVKNPVDRENIFRSYTGVPEEIIRGLSIENNYNSGKEYAKAGEYDFSMRLMPFGNNVAPPSITIVGKNIETSENTGFVPIIYGDKKDVSHVEIHIKEENGKFYTRFKTEQDSFPNINSGDFAEFYPAGKEIKLLIDSTKREYKNDNSGVNLFINNTSSREFIVEVINDDQVKPRVKIEDSKNVRVVYS